MDDARARTVSSFTIIKGSLIEETYAVFQAWDLQKSKAANLSRLRELNLVGARTESWLRDVRFVLSRRFDPAGRDRPLVELAQAGFERHLWKPILLWHITRNEFLVRDFLVHWLYPHYAGGTYRIRTEDVVPYLRALAKKKDVRWSGHWTEATTARVAQGLLRLAVDFGLLTGSVVRRFASYHLPEESFLYLLHAMAEKRANARRIVDSEDWHMYLMDAGDVEREILRLHQFHKLHYQVAGSLAQLDLPYASSTAYVRELSL
jgi:hypothetical protein